MKKYITVFFNGTGHAKSNPCFLANWLFALRQESDSQLFMNFDGIGVVNPIMGTIFGTGMDKHCQEVIEKVRECIESGDEVILNVYGHSRGGISALMLAKQLSNINPFQLSINLALHDPVPGNLLVTPYFDAWDISLANKFMDLSMCKPLKNVLALYPHKPLMFHAPLFPDYPANTDANEIILPGCHAGAQYQGAHNEDWPRKQPETKEEFLNPDFYNPESYIAFENVFSFLKKHGSSMDEIQCIWYPGIKRGEVNIEDAYEVANKNFSGIVERYGHSSFGQYINTRNSGAYFNDQHQILATKDDSEDAARSTFAYSQRYVSNFVRDLILGLILATGFSALIFFTSPLGLGISIAIGVGLIALSMSPLGKYAAERFFYPDYQVQDFKTKELDEPLSRMSYA